MANTPSVILACTLGASVVYFSTKEHSQPPVVQEIKQEKASPASVQASPAKPAPTVEQELEKKDQQWPHKGAEIPADAKAVWGKLPNGFQYVIYPNNTPKDLVAMRLHIDTGSLMENENQRGLAHFIEHMVFNGTRHYKAGELVPIMQRLGIKFGAHMNAFTSFDQTVYMLDLPNSNEETLKLGYTVMRDFGDGALMDIEEIDKERGVVLAEKYSRDSVQFRLLEKQFAALLPNALITNRFPIGVESVLKTATRELFLDYYHRFYTPKRMTLVVVSNLDPKTIEARIAREFGTMEEPKEPGKNPVLGEIPSTEGVKTHVFADAEVASTSLTLTSISPFANLPDTVESRQTELQAALANQILSKRFERLAKQPDAPILDGSADSSELFRFVKLNQLSVTVNATRWEEALPILENEYRRMVEFGITDAELQEAKANVLNSFQQAVASKDTRKSGDLASGIAETIQEKNVLSSPETDLEIVTKSLASISPESCAQTFRDAWKNTGYHLILTTKEAPQQGEKKLSDGFQRAAAQKVQAPENKPVATFAYNQVGQPGKIVSTKNVPALGIQQLKFENNVRVNLKKTDFEKNVIQVKASFGNGLLSLPRTQPGLHFVANAVINRSGLGKHDLEELQRIFAGKNVGSDFSLDDSRFAISGTTKPKDLELQLQLLCAQFTDPGYREQALTDFRNTLPALEQKLKHTMSGPMSEVQSWLHGDDPRYQAIDPQKLAGYTIADLQAWLAPEFSRGYLEVSIVGDFDEATLKPLLAKTLGALPKREATQTNLEKDRKITMPNSPANKQLTYTSEVEQGYALTLWKIKTMRKNQYELRRLNILSDIVSNHLREEIREKLGAAYSPTAMLNGSTSLDNFGYIMAYSNTKPDQIAQLQEVSQKIGNDLAKNGISDDDFKQVIQPAIETIKQSERENDYWLDVVLNDCQAEPTKILLASNRLKDTLSIKLPEIQALAKKYLGSDKAISVSISSQKQKELAKPAAPEPPKPIEPAPVTPAPTQPVVPETPKPIEPAPVTPAPTQPAVPETPKPIEPAPVTPAPTQPAAPEAPKPIEPAPVTPAPNVPEIPAQPIETPPPASPTPAAPVTPASPSNP